MDGRGLLKISVARVAALPPTPPAIGQLPAGPWIRVAVEDTGSGLPNGPEIFQPWFSTKAAHGGTGLGLFVARKFCEEQKAALWLVSRANQGTTIELWLQAADLDREPPPPVTPHRLLLTGADQERTAGWAKLCRSQGYSAVICPDPEGLRLLLGANSSEFDALVLIGADFPATRAWLRREKIRLRTLLVTDTEEPPDVDMVLHYPDEETFLRRLRTLF